MRGNSKAKLTSNKEERMDQNQSNDCGRGNHTWKFEKAYPPGDKYPNYFYNCSKCGRSGLKTEQSGPMKSGPYDGAELL